MTAVGDFNAISETARVMLQAGIGLLLQSGFVLLLAFAFGSAFRRKGPSLQVAICKAAICAVAATTLVGAIAGGRVHPLLRLSLPMYGHAQRAAKRVSYADVPVPWPSATTSVREGRLPALQRRLSAINGAPERQPSEAYRVARLGTPAIVYVALAAVWLIVALGLLGWTMLGCAALARLSRSSTPAKNPDLLAAVDDISHALGISPPDLRTHPQAETPYVAGFFRLVVFLPVKYASSIAPSELRAILAHELAHVHYQDFGWNLFFLVMRALLWPQALLWCIHMRWRQSSEERCDEWVVSRQCSAQAYAECLLQMAERCSDSSGGPAAAMGLMVRRAGLAARIRRILEHTQATIVALPSGVKAACGLCAALTAVVSMLIVSTAGSGAAGAAHHRHPAIASATRAGERTFSNLALKAVERGPLPSSTKRNQPMLANLTKRAAPAVATLAALLGNPIGISLPPAHADTSSQAAATAPAAAAPSGTSTILRVSDRGTQVQTASSVGSASLPLLYSGPLPLDRPIYQNYQAVNVGEIRTISGTWGCMVDDSTVAGEHFPYRCWPQFGSSDPTVFDVKGCSSFQTYIGLMDGLDGDATFRIDVDGKKVYEDHINSHDKAVFVSIPLTGHETLSLYRIQHVGDAACYFKPELLGDLDAPPTATNAIDPGVTAMEQVAAKGFLAVTNEIEGSGSAPTVTANATKGTVSLSADNSPLDVVLRTLFKVGGQSCVIAPGAYGTVTAELTNISFDTALQSVLEGASQRPTVTVRLQGKDKVYYFGPAAQPAGQPAEQQAAPTAVGASDLSTNHNGGGFGGGESQ